MRLGRPSASSPRLQVLERARLELDLGLPEVAASARASVCLVGVQMALRTRAPACLRRLWGSQGGRALVTRPFPRGWLPGRRELICLSVGKASRTLLPARVCSGLDSSETETSRTPGPASPQGILPGFTFYGEVLEAGRSAVWSLGRAGDVASLPPSSSSPGVTPAPPPLLGTSSGSPGSTWADKLGWFESWPCRSPSRFGFFHCEMGINNAQPLDSITYV